MSDAMYAIRTDDGWVHGWSRKRGILFEPNGEIGRVFDSVQLARRFLHRHPAKSAEIVKVRWDDGFGSWVGLEIIRES